MFQMRASLRALSARGGRVSLRRDADAPVPSRDRSGRRSAASRRAPSSATTVSARRPLSAAAEEGGGRDGASRRRRIRPSRRSRFETADASIGLVPNPRDSSASAERLSGQSLDLLGGDAAVPYSPRTADGEDMPMDDYLKMASLSPWVPVPDMVARRVLDVSRSGPDTVHYDLGSGDGRVNFHAVDTYGVKKSVGIDIDPGLVEISRDRISRRHPRPENVEFLCADLLDPDQSEGIWDRIGEECTVLTMYFVEEALQKLRPKLEEKLVGTGCRIVTVGYEMKGWEPSWVEVNLGLTMHMYEMKNKDSPPTPEQPPSWDEIKEVAGDESLADQLDNLTPDQKDLVLGEPMPQGQEPTPMEEPDYYYEPNEGEDFHWDFDETKEYDENGNEKDEVKEDEHGKK